MTDSRDHPTNFNLINLDKMKLYETIGNILIIFKTNIFIYYLPYMKDFCKRRNNHFEQYLRIVDIRFQLFFLQLHFLLIQKQI